jgi:hypothetical protein
MVQRVAALPTFESPRQATMVAGRLQQASLKFPCQVVSRLQSHIVVTKCPFRSTAGELMRKLVLLFIAVSAACAQTPANPSAQVEAIKKCSFLAGEWNGVGWQTLGTGQRRAVHQSESVQTKLDGLVLQIDGLGKDDQGKFVQSILVVISFDPASKQYRFHAYDGQGQVLDADANCADGVFSWHWNADSLQFRFAIRLNSKRQWSELGESSNDGKTWQKRFEIAMDRKR